MQTLKTNIREELIRVATEEFKVNGYEQASLRQIAKQVGMSVGNVYRYYPNKAQLFDAVISEPLTYFTEILKLNIQDYPEALDAFKALIETFAFTITRLIKENQDALFVLLNHKESSDLIQAHLSMFLKQLAFHWYESMDMTREENELLMEMLAKGIFNGIIHAVENSEGIHQDTFKVIITQYLELHLYMTYAVQGNPHETI